MRAGLLPRQGLRCIIAVLVLAALPASAGAWGWLGHKLISELALDLLPAEVRAVYAPVAKQYIDATLEPDKRVRTDPREGPKHFLNAEVLHPEYRAAWELATPGDKRRRKAAGHRRKGGVVLEPEVAPSAAPAQAAKSEGPTVVPLQREVFMGRMPLAPGVVDRLFAEVPRDERAFREDLPPAFQRELGAVVYQPAHYHAELVKAFRANDAARIAGITGYLSHYVGDLHVPLHTTIDHEGAYSGSVRTASGVHQTVHSRFETGFVKYLGPTLKSLAAAQTRPAQPQPAAGITARAIATARASYSHSAEVLAIDKATMRVQPGGNIAWQRFYAAFEPRMAPLVARQVALSAQMLADLILSAWQESRR